MRLYTLYIVVKFQTPSYNTFGDMNFFSSPDGRTESDAYEPTVHMHRWAQKKGNSYRPHLGNSPIFHLKHHF